MLPVLFRIGPFTVHSYGTLLMIGFLAGILLARRQARRLGLSSELALDLALWILIGALPAARALFVALHWPDYAERPAEALYLWKEGGLSFHGGLLGGVLAAALFSRRRRLPFLTLADMVTPGLALGYGIARFGCLLNACCYGAPTSLPWGIRFPIFPDSSILTEPSHPTQVYSALGSFAILTFLLWVQPRLRARGQLFLLYLASYSVLRSAVEVLRRGYTARVLAHGITEAQALSAAIFIGALAGLLILRGRARNRPIQGPPDPSP